MAADPLAKKEVTEAEAALDSAGGAFSGTLEGADGFGTWFGSPKKKVQLLIVSRFANYYQIVT
jgi:hypothetical protein